MSVDFDLLIPLEPVPESDPVPAEVGEVSGAAAPSPCSESSTPAEAAVSERGTLTLRIEQVRREAEGVNSFVFTDPAGAELPEWEPGDHLDVHLPSGAIRQYSLCGDLADRSYYRVAVLEQPDGRGGSLEVHRELRPGRLVELGLPRSNFALEDAAEYVFIAGGIGITPISAMIQSVAAAGKTWTLYFGARSRAHFAFVPELERHVETTDPDTSPVGSSGAGAIALSPQDETGHMDLASIVSAHPAAQIYCCGPAPLMDALTDLIDEAGRIDDLHLERFDVNPLAAPVSGDDNDGGVGTFEVELARTGGTISVGADETVLEAVRRSGVDHPSSCEMGICGTCETRVVSGDIDHRDDLLTETEKAKGDCMLICVSRANCPKLVLDL